MKQKKLKGFTLIELLVVIAIIGILSSFAVVSLNGARGKARDALRKADMTQIRTAIMLYYDDNNKYPVCNPSGFDNTKEDLGATVAAGSVCYVGTLKPALSTGAKPFLSPMPKDPLNPNNDPTIAYVYRYLSNSNGSEYALLYRIEDSTDDQVIRGW